MRFRTGEYEALGNDERSYLYGQGVQNPALRQDCLMDLLRAQFPNQGCSKFNGRLIMMAFILLAKDTG